MARLDCRGQRERAQIQHQIEILQHSFEELKKQFESMESALIRAVGNLSNEVAELRSLLSAQEQIPSSQRACLYTPLPVLSQIGLPASSSPGTPEPPSTCSIPHPHTSQVAPDVVREQILSSQGVRLCTPPPVWSIGPPASSPPGSPEPPSICLIRQPYTSQVAPDAVQEGCNHGPVVIKKLNPLVRMENATLIETSDARESWFSHLRNTLLVNNGNLVTDLADFFERYHQDFQVQSYCSGSRSNKMFIIQCRKCHGVWDGWWSFHEEQAVQQGATAETRAKGIRAVKAVESLRLLTEPIRDLHARFLPPPGLPSA